jgi:cytochrome c553
MGFFFTSFRTIGFREHAGSIFSGQKSAHSILTNSWKRHRNFVITCLLFIMLSLLSCMDARAAGDPSLGSTRYNDAAYCVQCHISPPEGARLIAANNSSFIQAAIDRNEGGADPAGTDWMGQSKAGQPKALSTAQLNDIAAYIGLFVVPTTANKSVTVAANSGANAIRALSC